MHNVAASFMMYHSSSYEGLGSGNPVDSYNQADIRLAIPFRKNKFKGEIAFVSQNITGVKIFDWGEDNLMGNRNLITITGKFN